MTALSEVLDALILWHSPVLDPFLPETVREPLALQVLAELGLESDGPEIPEDKQLGLLLLLDVFVWRRVEAQAALSYDFSADGASFSRSQLLQNATRMRIRAENAAYSAGYLTGEEAAVIFVGFPPQRALGDEWKVCP